MSTRWCLLLLVMAAGVRADATKLPKKPNVPNAQRCGCATSRFLTTDARTLATDDGAALWLHGRDQLIDVGDNTIVHEEPGGRSRLMRLRSQQQPPPQPGILRPSDKVAREVLLPAPVAAQSAPPSYVAAMWLSPLEVQARPSCAVEPVTSHRLAVQGDGIERIVAFRITNKDQTTLVDARHIGAFGIGAMDVCGHGVDVEARVATEFTITPIDIDGHVGASWRFGSDGMGGVPQRLESPLGRDEDLLSAPFPSPTDGGVQAVAQKKMSTVVMATTLGGALLVAFAAWIIIPARRRRMTTIACPSCRTAIPFDALDPGTDGFFCPRCGAAGVWTGRGKHAAQASLLR
jgi:hypothetical protein